MLVMYVLKLLDTIINLLLINLNNEPVNLKMIWTI